MQPPVHTESKPITNGPLLAVLMLVLLILLGGLYYWYTTLDNTSSVGQPLRPTADQNREPETPTAMAQTEVLEVVSTSDELPALAADIEATNLDMLDIELTAIDAELSAALLEL